MLCATRFCVAPLLTPPPTPTHPLQLLATPGVCAAPDAETQQYIFQQTMLRIKDPSQSLDFYTRVLGMTLICKLDFPEMAFTLYFLAYCDPAEVLRGLQLF
jgi:lactoylglutathione lyase